MKRNSIIKSIMVFLISFVWIIQGITSPIVALEEPVSENTIVENQDGTEQQDENGNQNEIDVTDSSQDQETAEETVIENKEDELTKEDSDNQVESKEQNTNAAIPGDSSLVEYFYVGSPYLTTPATQQFILSFGTGAEGITSVKLEYQKDGEEELSLDVARQQSNLYVFERSFTEAESGTYKVNGFTYVIDNQTYEVSFSDLEMDIRFGVNQEYEGYGTAEGYTVDANGNEVQEEAIDTQGLSEAEIDTSVVTLDGSNADQTEALVEDALQNNALPSVQSRSRSNSITTYSETNPLVICIDPGHGGNDSGTIIVNGAYEKNYNLKIAQYLKAELEQYKNVKVVMTRTGDTNPSLQQRAQIAADAGATALVSIHLNATGWGTQSTVAGAEVYYPSSYYNAATSTTGKNLAQNILNQLVGLGIQNRGIKVKYVYNTETGQPAHHPAYDYPDGSVGDYYGVIRYSKLVGVSGIIVEHCMADNWNDFNKFLSSDAKLKQLGVADATGIAKAFGLSKISRNDLDTLASQNKSVLADGTYFIQSALSSNYVVDVKSAGTANYVNVQLYKKNNTDAQGWKVTHDSKGYVTFTNVNSGKVLDVNAAKATNYQNVQQYASNGTYAQKWVVVKDGSSYKIISALNQNYVLDLNAAKTVNSQNIQIYQSNNTKAQRWTFAKYQTVRQRLDSLASQNKSVLANGTYYIQSALSSNYVADVKSAGTANYVNVQLYKKNNTDAQGWKVTHDSKGYVTFTNVNSGKVLDVNAAKATNYQNVQQYASNGTYAQKWVVVKDGSSYKIISALNQNYVLDLNAAKTVNSQNIQIYQSNNTKAQRWTFAKYQTVRQRLDSLASQNKSVLANGTYYIQSALSSNYVVDVKSAGTANYVNVQLYKKNYTNAQKWKVTHDSKGYVTFTSVNSGKVLDVNAAKATNYQNVQQYASNGTYAQKWVVVKDGSSYKIISALNQNYVLDLNAAKTVNSQNIQIYQSNNTKAQRWTFSSVTQVKKDYPIMGTSSVSAKQLANYYNSYKGSATYDKYTGSNAKYNGTLSKGGATTIEQFCQIFLEECQAEGVKAEVAFAQAMHETGFLKFGGDVLPNQYNFAGLGATGNGAHGNSFKDVRTGIRAQVQHLKCYASTEPLNQAKVDPRWSDSLRGKAPTVEKLQGTWATSNTYASSLMTGINRILKS